MNISNEALIGLHLNEALGAVNSAAGVMRLMYYYGETVPHNDIAQQLIAIEKAIVDLLNIPETPPHHANN